MQAIRTHFIPCTNTRGSRIKAACERGSIVVSADSCFTGENLHRAAVDALVAKFVKEDAARYGEHRNPWQRPFVSGGLPDGSYAHIFLDYSTPALLSSLTSILEHRDRMGLGDNPIYTAARAAIASTAPFAPGM
jgi:hypothetical protein